MSSCSSNKIYKGYLKLFQTTYKRVFMTNIPDNIANLGDQYSNLVDYSRAAFEIFDILEISSNVYAPYILKLLKKPDFFEFNEIIEIDDLKKQICSKFLNKYNTFINCISILLSLSEYLHLKNHQKLENFQNQANHLFMEFKNTTKIEIGPTSKITKINMSRIIKSISLKSLKSHQLNLEKTKNKFELMKYQNHLCLSCRVFPAVFFMEPCKHAAFCQHCMNELNSINTVFEHCYYCQALVEKFEYLRFLNK
ncbi:hypothetical protein TRFO_28722 [Tritrichomonas foetus]|uniref:RING-type domain-containing protein n=1 Tax=Tritrichomonas foetus TaxID=1144522 RepID=A0A1J4JXR3_9EUKA|nr:hypothetical protein TRFO_28722 [Tritrichomonas foetus]|eukprot:OHT03937.1 hypothetical protein TRFO_28722 [Tritrichomonas foetus]